MAFPIEDIDNVMRSKYRSLSDLDKEHMAVIKESGARLYNEINSLGESREISLAKTKVEEAVMWATKAITR